MKLNANNDQFSIASILVSTSTYRAAAYVCDCKERSLDGFCKDDDDDADELDEHPSGVDAIKGIEPLEEESYSCTSSESAGQTMLNENDFS